MEKKQAYDNNNLSSSFGETDEASKRIKYGINEQKFINLMPKQDQTK